MQVSELPFWPAVVEVWTLITSEPILLWMLLIAVVVGVGSALGSVLGKTVRLIFAVISGVLGVFVIYHIITALGG